MRNLIPTLLITTCACCFIAGCASNKGYGPDTGISANPLKTLDSTSVEANKKLTELAAANDAVKNASMTPAQRQQDFYQATVIPQGFEKPATLNFVGKAPKAAKMVADLAGYDFRIVGSPPAVPLMVNIKANATMLRNIVQSIAQQIGNQATINIYPAARLVEFIYPSK